MTLWQIMVFFSGASNENLEAVKSADPAKIAGVKVFMGSSTGNMLVDEETVLEGIFCNAPTIIATHCEDTPMILATKRMLEINMETMFLLLNMETSAHVKPVSNLHPWQELAKRECQTSCPAHHHRGGT